MVQLRTPARTRLTYLALCCLCIVAIIYEVHATKFRVWDHFGQKTWTPFTVTPSGAAADVAGQAVFVEDDASNAGLRNGDFVTAINGRTLTGKAIIGEEVNRTHPGSLLEVVFHENVTGREKTILLRRPLESRPDLVNILIVVVLPWLALVLGFWVVFARPDDFRAWLVLGLMWTYMCFYYSGPEFWPRWLRGFGASFRAGATSSLPIWLLLFAIYFPEDFPPGSRWAQISRWKWILLAPLGARVLSRIAIAVSDLENWNSLGQLREMQNAFALFGGILLYISVAAVFLLLGAKYLRAVSLDSKRRLRLLFIGAVFTLGPYLLVELAQVMGGFIFEQRHQNFSWLIYVVFFLFPFVLAYVILVHKAMDIRVALRQSLQYALARNGIRVIQLIMTIMIIVMALILIRGRSGSLLGEIAVVAAGLLIVQALGRGSDKMRLWVDKRFFREAYNAERVLSEVSDQVRTMVEPESLLKLVAKCISSSLHVPHIAVLVDCGNRFCPIYLQGLGKVSELCFSSDSRTVTELQKNKEPIRVYLEDHKSWIYQNPTIGEAERAEMARLQTELLLPLAGHKKLLGFISLGGKQSGEPFTGSDLRLLKSVATQAGLALENTQLLAAITREIAQRERMNREIEIAREVQERLFPPPVSGISGVDCWGACRSAEGVGGDYYDFLKLQNGALGIAIGDISGKGISASLLMTSLVFALRSEAIRGSEELPTLVSNVNSLVYHASTVNRYATLFLGVYHPNSRQLSYVNAGHNPPMLFRKLPSSVQVIRLGTTGTPVGLFEHSPYRQEEITLQPGDVLVAYTDGITEAVDLNENEWGEDRLIRTVSACTNLTAEDMLARIMRDADAFAAGARQHDDMTLITLKITA